MKQFLIWAKVVWYRRKYSIDELGKKFYLVWFNGKLILFDKTNNSNMTYHHVYPWGTAEDLKFVGRGYDIKADMNQYKAIKIGSRELIRLNKYKEGEPINTQS